MTARLQQRLVAAARAARRNAFAPYSKFTVGAAVLDERGRIHRGCNVENSSYGLTTCAERNAVAAAVAAGARQVRAIAIAGPIDPPVRPCGACRQVLAEFARPDTPILMAPARGTRATTRTLGELLPESFRL